MLAATRVNASAPTADAIRLHVSPTPRSPLERMVAIASAQRGHIAGFLRHGFKSYFFQEISVAAYTAGGYQRCAVTMY